jgi:hypothetical protein
MTFSISLGLRTGATSRLHAKRRACGLERMEEKFTAAGSRIGVEHNGRMFNRGCDLLEQLQPLASHCIFEIDEAGNVATGPRQAGDKTGAYGIGHKNKYDRNAGRFALKRSRHRCGLSEDDVGLEGDQSLRKLLDLLDIGARPAIVDLQVAAVRPT